MVATFDPHPVSHFDPKAAPFRLTSLDQRQELFAAAGADAMLVFEFDDALARTSAGFRSRTAGRPDRRGGRGDRRGFHLRRKRGGNIEMLRTLGAAHGLAARGRSRAL
jgi:riboflavin kinase/FMN adenylyltransferase